MRAAYAENDTFDGFLVPDRPHSSARHAGRSAPAEGNASCSNFTGAVLDVHAADTVTAP
jgi:hypothetical protein